MCKIALEMWKVLRVTHEGTNDVKSSRKNSLINIRIQDVPNATMENHLLHKRFTYIFNHLTCLGNFFILMRLILKF